jgi:hypothetical protein
LPQDGIVISPGGGWGRNNDLLPANRFLINTHVILSLSKDDSLYTSLKQFLFFPSTFLWKKVEPKPLAAQGAFLCLGLSRMDDFCIL